MGAQVSDTMLSCWSATEANTLCQQLMREGHFPPTHLFANVLDHLGTAKARFNALKRPPTAAAKQTGAAAAAAEPPSAADTASADVLFARMESFLHAERSKLFPPDRKAFCLMHRRDCPMLWQPSSDKPSSSLHRPLRWNISGPLCKAWSAFGLRKQLSDASTEPWLVWSTAMSQSGLDLVTVENSDQMPVEVFANKMSSPPGQWFVIPLVLNCTDRIVNVAISGPGVGICLSVGGGAASSDLESCIHIRAKLVIRTLSNLIGLSRALAFR